jgi:hypothetical protein
LFCFAKIDGDQCGKKVFNCGLNPLGVLVVKLSKEKYSHHLKTEPSGIQMVISWTLFESGFQMALAAIFYDRLLIKRSWLATIRKPDLFVRFLNGSKT